MKVQHFFDPDTFTLTYVVFDPDSRDAIVIDPVLDLDPASGKITEKNCHDVTTFLRNERLTLHWILETHAHADHLSGSQVLKRAFPGSKIAISQRISSVQKIFSGLFNLNDQAATASDFDYLFNDNETLKAGAISISTLPTPGHTPACTSFVIGDLVFTGDSLFMPDYGTGRCDFPEGSAKELYHSIQKLYALPDSYKVFVGHDYKPNGRELKFESTIGESKKSNIHLKSATTESEYVSFREARDKTLNAPKLLFQSLQVNIRGGKLPSPESNGKIYLKLPLSV